ncbi:MAG: outer membrane lipid asymmetry maintenance protein MlaD [Gammaproteobacteria bacterium]
MHPRKLEFFVGLFILTGIISLIILALNVSGLSTVMSDKTYNITATFDNIGDLKVRAPVTISGVRIGQIESIRLDPDTYRADITMRIKLKYNDIPVDSSAKILTEGLLGSNYISITPGFQNVYLKEGGKIDETHSALILEDLIGQLLFKVNGNNEGGKQ